MKKRVLAITLFAVVAVSVFVLALRPRRLGVITADPIALRYIQTGEFNNGGYTSSGTTFWATNHTSNTLMIHLSAIDVKNGSNWLTQSQPTRLISFQPQNAPYPLPTLAPHGAGYGTLQLPGLSPGSIWRMKVHVAEQLTGPEAAVARVKRYPSLLKVRVQSGDTNIPWTPFSPGFSFFGAGTEVVSQEIVEE